MPPYLFAIGTEYVTRCLNTINHDSNFDFRSDSKRIMTILLLFADDLLVYVNKNKRVPRKLENGSSHGVLGLYFSDSLTLLVYSLN